MTSTSVNTEKRLALPIISSTSVTMVIEFRFVLLRSCLPVQCYWLVYSSPLFHVGEFCKCVVRWIVLPAMHIEIFLPLHSSLRKNESNRCCCLHGFGGQTLSPEHQMVNKRKGKGGRDRKKTGRKKTDGKKENYTDSIV